MHIDLLLIYYVSAIVVQPTQSSNDPVKEVQNRVQGHYAYIRSFSRLFDDVRQRSIKSTYIKNAFMFSPIKKRQLSDICTTKKNAF